MNWHRLDPSAVLRESGTDAAIGLTEPEAARRLTQHGRNELTGTGIRSPWRILWDQLTAFMVVILIVAAVVSALLADYKDARRYRSYRTSQRNARIQPGVSGGESNGCAEKALGTVVASSAGR